MLMGSVRIKAIGLKKDAVEILRESEEYISTVIGPKGAAGDHEPVLVPVIVLPAVITDEWYKLFSNVIEIPFMLLDTVCRVAVICQKRFSVDSITGPYLD